MNESIMNKLAWYTMIFMSILMIASAFSKELSIGMRLAIIGIFTPTLIFAAEFLFYKNMF